MKKIAFTAGLLSLALTTSVFAAAIQYDSKSSPAAIAIDQQVKAEADAKVYPTDPTPSYMLVNSVCTGKNAFGCTSGGGAAGAAGAAGE